MMSRATLNGQQMLECDRRQDMLLRLRRVVAKVASDINSATKPIKDTDELIFKMDSSGRNLLDLIFEPLTES